MQFLFKFRFRIYIHLRRSNKKRNIARFNTLKHYNNLNVFSPYFIKNYLPSTKANCLILFEEIIIYYYYYYYYYYYHTKTINTIMWEIFSLFNVTVGVSCVNRCVLKCYCNFGFVVCPKDFKLLDENINTTIRNLIKKLAKK
jgi:hypothetical protein